MCRVFRFAYFLTSNCSGFTRSANAFQKERLVVENLGGIILVPSGCEHWVHDEFRSSVRTFVYPPILLSPRLVKLCYPIMYMLGCVQYRKCVAEWLFSPSNELTFLGVCLVELLFHCKAYLFCWDPPGVAVRDGRSVWSKLRCWIMDFMMGLAVRHSELMIMNLHPGFLESRFGSNTRKYIRCYPNGTCIDVIRRIVDCVAQVPKRIGINSAFISSKGCMEQAELFGRLWMADHEVSLVWVGNGKDVDKVRAYFRRVGIPDASYIIGHYQHQEALKLLGSASIAFCWYKNVPSLRWNYVLKVPEFLAMGVPVVASDLPGIREYINDGENGYLFDPQNLEQPYRLLMDLLHGGSLKGFQAAAVSWIRAYDWDLINQRISDSLK